MRVVPGDNCSTPYERFKNTHLQQKKNKKSDGKGNEDRLIWQFSCSSIQ